MAFKDPAAEWPPDQRPAFGDVLGGLTIAGGIAAALVRRERTGTPSIVDVSLLGMGMWALAPDITAAKLYEGIELPTFDRDSMPNPLVGTYPTKDGRYIILLLLQADRFWPDLCEHLDRPDLIDDPRFKDGASRYENRGECIQLLREIFRSRTYEEWVRAPRHAEGRVGAAADRARTARRSAGDRQRLLRADRRVERRGVRVAGESGAVRRDAALGAAAHPTTVSTPTRYCSSSGSPTTRSSSTRSREPCCERL